MGTYFNKSQVKSNVKLSDIASSWLFICGIGIGILVWFVDLFIDVVIFNQGTFYHQLTEPGASEIYMRTVLSFVIVIFSFVIAVLFFRSKHIEMELRESHEIIKQNYHIQNVVSSILQQSLEPVTLKESLRHTLNTILSEPLFSLKKKGSIFLVDSNNEMLNLEVHNGFDEIQQVTCARLPFGVCLCGRAASSREIIFTGDVDERHEYRYDNMHPHGHYCVPILSGDQVLGVINAYVSEGHKKTQDEEKFLSMIADTLAGIIERKQGEDALQQRTQELGERVKELTTLYSLSKILDRQDTTLIEIMEAVVNVLPPAWYYPEVTCARINFDGREFTTGNFRETIWKQASSIIVHGEQAGTVEIFYLEEKPDKDEGPFLKDERNLIDEIALRLGESCERMYRDKQIIESRENLRDLAKRLQAIREEERTMIAREIHDELGQTLTGLKMDLSWLLGRLPKGWKHLPHRAQEMISLIDSTINFVRKLSTELRPSMLDDLGLKAAIEWQVQEFATRMDCKYNLRINILDHQSDRDLDTAIFRILQESLTNIARHAKADYIEISMDEVDTQLVLSIKDNGIGIDEEKINSTSLGLISMRERANTFGGKFSIKALEDGGSMVTLSMPYLREET